jgi:hypothetical protein
MRNAYRLLMWILMIATISTTTNVVTLNASWLWPLAFFIGLLVCSYFYGKWLDMQKLVEEDKVDANS